MGASEEQGERPAEPEVDRHDREGGRQLGCVVLGLTVCAMVGLGLALVVDGEAPGEELLPFLPYLLGALALAGAAFRWPITTIRVVLLRLDEIGTRAATPRPKAPSDEPVSPRPRPTPPKARPFDPWTDLAPLDFVVVRLSRSMQARVGKGIMSVAVTVGVGAVVLMATELLPANDAMKGLLALAFWGWVGGLIVWYRTV